METNNDKKEVSLLGLLWLLLTLPISLFLSLRKIKFVLPEDEYGYVDIAGLEAIEPYKIRLLFPSLILWCYIILGGIMGITIALLLLAPLFM